MHRLALALIAFAAVLIGIAYAAAFLPAGAPAWAPWLLAFGTATILVAAIALGALRHGAGVAVPAALAFTFIVLAGGFALALALPEPDPSRPVLWFGLPRRAAIVMYGIGLLPMFVLPLAYALTFERTTLSSADWERVRRAAAAARDEAPPR